MTTTTASAAPTASSASRTPTASSSSTLRSDTQYPGAIVQEFDQRAGAFSGNALSAEYDHLGRSWYWLGQYQDYDTGFRADSGFLPQVDVRTVTADSGYQFWGAQDDWYTTANVGGAFTRSYDHEGHLTDEGITANGALSWARQSTLMVVYKRGQVYFGDTRYRGLDTIAAAFQQQPTGLLKYGVTVRAGDSVDYANGRPATVFQLSPSLELKPGRHLNAQLSYTMRVLDAADMRVFRADLAQLRVVQQFSVRSFVRAILQYQTIASNGAAYASPVEPRTRTLFSQLLYSYKLNPQTVLFLGLLRQPPRPAGHRPDPDRPHVLPEDRLRLAHVGATGQVAPTGCRDRPGRPCERAFCPAPGRSGPEPGRVASLVSLNVDL